MVQVKEVILEVVSQLLLQKQVGVKNFAEFLLSKETRSQEISDVYLLESGIDEAEAAKLRVRLRTFYEDWERPEMGVYDAL